MADPEAREAAEHIHHRHIPFTRRHPYTVNELQARKATPGQRAADRLAATLGSWRFIAIQSVVLAIWISLNAIGWIRHWDPYPFILLNLALSFQAAYSAPIIMMSQNRQAEKDRLAAEEDYRINAEAEFHILDLHSRFDHLAKEQWDELMALQRRQIEILEHLTEPRER